MEVMEVAISGLSSDLSALLNSMMAQKVDFAQKLLKVNIEAQVQAPMNPTGLGTLLDLKV
jgi:hypothetical protein